MSTTRILSSLVAALFCIGFQQVLARELPEPVSVTGGAADCDGRIKEYRVTKLSDSGGRGTFRDAVHIETWNRKAIRKKSCRRVVFTVEGTIQLEVPIRIASDYLTIDGCSAPGEGITIAQDPDEPEGVVIDGTKRHTHDVLLRCLRFKGIHDEFPRHKVGEAALSIDADCTRHGCESAWGEDDPVGGVSRISLERIVFSHSTDKFTVWGKAEDVSVSRSFFYRNPLAFLVSFYGGARDLERRRIYVQQNVFADNNERNPQLRGWISSIDIRNNIIHGWDAFPPLRDDEGYPGDGYGIRIKNEAGEKAVNANIVGNAFTRSVLAQRRALIYGINQGPDRDESGPRVCLGQGDVFEDSRMGRLWVRDNRIPFANCDVYSTVRQEVIDAGTDTVGPGELCELLPAVVGMPQPTPLEQEILEDTRNACLGVPSRVTTINNSRQSTTHYNQQGEVM